MTNIPHPQAKLVVKSASDPTMATGEFCLNGGPKGPTQVIVGGAQKALDFLREHPEYTDASLYAGSNRRFVARLMPDGAVHRPT